ncbi:MAG TPA: PQQ-dependent sugar dehydrogenase [Candidatus Paceibacterota bacterium]|nr:PQQ-dependent sugar dehydrogenase [Candidatus Paceibacterota bacterium]
MSIIIMAGAGVFLWKANIGTVNIPDKASIAETENAAANSNTVSSLPGFILPAGFSLNIFAKNVPDARVIEMDPKGRILVSEPSEGKIVALIDKDNNHISDEQKILASGLNRPHGMAFNCNNVAGQCFLYVAENDALLRFSYDADTPALGNKEKLMSIGSSPNNHHFTRSLLFLPSPNEDTLLISVGSSCNVCHETDPDNATILSYNIKTGKKEVYAKGLRNAVFMTLNPVSGKVFATEMGRDNVGDNIPPDEINIIEKKNDQPQNYGWPICYGKNIHDTQFDKNTYIRNPCMAPFETPSFIDLQAHSAPLGLSFIPEEGWGEEYWHNLLVAYHGSWNRTSPTGYKIVRIKMNSKGEYLGTEDFITGWLTKGGKKTGRPVDIKVFPGGVAYISDDESGVIYKLTAR